MEGEVVETRVIGDGGEEVEATVAASVDKVEGVTEVAIAVTPIVWVGVISVVLRVVVSSRVDRVVETIVVGGALGDGDGVSAVVTCSAAVVLGVAGVVVVGLTAVEEVVVALLVAVVVVAVAVLVVAVVVIVSLVVVVGCGAVVVLLDLVTKAKGVGVGGRDTPSGYD